MADSNLQDLRKHIDELNTRLLEILQERAEVVLEISRLKEEIGMQSHDPRREEEMLRKLTRASSGPFGPAELREIFRAVFRASLALQERERDSLQEDGHLRAGGKAR
jgi:3-deoxy-7-phosphoheptulonate synthase / chorismate mutase